MTRRQVPLIRASASTQATSRRSTGSPHSSSHLVILPVILLMVLIGSIVIALSLSGPSWSPTFAQRNTTLQCLWTNSSDTLAQNITLLKNGVYYNSTYENATNVNLSSSFTLSGILAKPDVWTCRVTLYNDTASTTNDAVITISNSPPTTNTPPAGVFNASHVDVGSLVQIREDSSMIITVNATDPDVIDTITYYSTSGICVQSAPLNTYTCAPTQSNLVNNLPTLVNVSFIVTDGSEFGGRIITFNITPLNDPPYPVPSLSYRTTAVNMSMNYTFAVADEEGNVPYSFSLSAPSQIAPRLSITRLKANGSSMSIYYDASSVVFADIGVWNVTLNITDNSTTQAGVNDSATGTYSFLLNITPVGRAPYFNLTTANITPSNGIYTLAIGASIQVNMTANDPDANSTLAFTAVTNMFSMATVKADTNESDAQGQFNFTPVKNWTRNDVGLSTITIRVTDLTTLLNTTTITLNITNVNTPPQIMELSNDSRNTQRNVNASNLSVYANTLFRYAVNATDLDVFWGLSADHLTYSSNDSLYPIDATTGVISATPSAAQVDPTPYPVNITVNDTSGARASRVIYITVKDNNPPRFTSALPVLRCTTKSPACTLNLSSYALDPDSGIGDYVEDYSYVFIGTALSNFTLNATSGKINFTIPKTSVGNYTVNITITDTHGATNSSLMNISVNNTPEAPIMTDYDIGAGLPAVESHLFTYIFIATDEDFLLSSANERVNFTTNLSLSGTTVTITQLANTTPTNARARISFTPEPGTNGTYSVRINATDSYGFIDSKVVTFVIYPKEIPPEISNITPWGSFNTTHNLQTSYISTSDLNFSGAQTATVYLYENTSVLFGVNLTDALRSSLYNYTWTLNGSNELGNISVVLPSARNTPTYSHVFNFTAAGNYTITINVSDDARYESTTWTWDLKVININRAPIIGTGLANWIVNGSENDNLYFVHDGQGFIDPDDDLDSNGVLNLSSEPNHLTFTVNGTCPVASLSITDVGMRIVGVTKGSCTVAFIATDAAGLGLQSNNVSINVSDVVQGAVQTVTTTSSGGGGSSSTTQTFVPITKKAETPKAFNLIAPRLITIYGNKTMEIPITVNNTWNGPLKMVQLSMKSNSTGMNMTFDTDFFEEIKQNESKEVVLTVTNYRFGDNYEILVSGNVSTPEYSDQALILLNSIEQSKDGDDVNVKVTFANDLVNEHPECQELNEVLTEAKQRISEGNIEEGKSLVDNVINGCKYLVSTQQKIQEKPSRLNPIINIDDLSLKAIMLGVLAFVVLSSIAFLIYYHYSHKPEDDI